MSNETTAAQEAPDSYRYDEDAAGHAEDFANRITDNGAFTGVFLKVWPFTAQPKEGSTVGTKGVHFEFESIGKETASFDLYTIGPKGSKNKDGVTRTEEEKFPGYNQLMALMFLMGIKGALKTKKDKIETWEGEPGKRVKVEKEADIYPELCGKSIGIVFQKELSNNQTNGKETSRVQFLASFHPETKLTASEIKAGEKTPKKLERILKSLKTKDSRTHHADEPAQPSQGIPAGDY